MTNNDLPGKDASFWVDTTPSADYPQLQDDDTKIYDVILIGGGITGIAAAWMMQQEGLRTAILEKNRIAEDTTGSTTAKLTSQHYLIYNYLIEEYGERVARSYAQANQNGIDEIEKISQNLGIDCDFSRRNAYVYTQQDDTIAEIETEVEVTKRLGLPSSYKTTIDLPFDIKGAIKFSRQAQFHPRKFLLGLAKDLMRSGGKIFERTEATDIIPGALSRVITNQGTIKARYVVQATGGSPFWKPEMFNKAMWTKTSYALGVRLKEGSRYPQGMYITTDTPIRTIRSHPYEDGELLIFGGESHKYDKSTFDPEKRYLRLIKDVTEKYDVDKIEYRWLASDAMPYDRMPYIGEYPDYQNIFIATGYRAWGLAWAMAAAHILTDKILLRPVPWAEPFGLHRLTRT